MKKLVLILIVLLAAILAGYWFRGWLGIDRCLDAGGRWDAETRTCVMPTEVARPSRPPGSFPAETRSESAESPIPSAPPEVG